MRNPISDLIRELTTEALWDRYTSRCGSLCVIYTKMYILEVSVFGFRVRLPCYLDAKHPNNREPDASHLFGDFASKSHT